MPKLFDFDDYDECMSENVKYASNIYCISDVMILSNESSNLWKTIEKFSNPKSSHYQHSHLLHGVCVNKYKRELEHYEILRSRKESFKISALFNVSQFMFELNRFDYGWEDELKYGSLINKCINQRLKKKFQLKAVAKINYCIDDDKSRGKNVHTYKNFVFKARAIDKDFLFVTDDMNISAILFLLIISVTIFLNLLSIFIDYGLYGFIKK